MPDAQTFHLPFPPTSNTMFSMKGYRRFPSARYREWRDDAGMRLMEQRAEPVEGRVSIDIRLRRKDKRKWDIDNRVKPLLDLLVSHLILADDSTEVVRAISVQVDMTIDPGAQVTVSPLPPTDIAERID